VSRKKSKPPTPPPGQVVLTVVCKRREHDLAYVYVAGGRRCIQVPRVALTLDDRQGKGEPIDEPLDQCSDGSNTWGAFCGCRTAYAIYLRDVEAALAAGVERLLVTRWRGHLRR
jgi:hypothetical protein